MLVGRKGNVNDVMHVVTLLRSDDTAVSSEDSMAGVHEQSRWRRGTPVASRMKARAEHRVFLLRRIAVPAFIRRIG